MSERQSSYPLLQRLEILWKVVGHLLRIRRNWLSCKCQVEGDCDQYDSKKDQNGCTSARVQMSYVPTLYPFDPRREDDREGDTDKDQQQRGSYYIGNIEEQCQEQTDGKEFRSGARLHRWFRCEGSTSAAVLCVMDKSHLPEYSRAAHSILRGSSWRVLISLGRPVDTGSPGAC